MVDDVLLWHTAEEPGGHSTMGEFGASQPTSDLDAVQGGSGAWPTAAAGLNNLFH